MNFNTFILKFYKASIEKLKKYVKRQSHQIVEMRRKCFTNNLKIRLETH